MTTEGEFYVTGGTLPPNAPCYIVRQADDDLFRALRDGEFCYVLTSRQMGKSSLMQRTALRLRETGAAVVTLDLTKFGSSLVLEQWYFSLARMAARQTGTTRIVEKFWEANSDLGPLQRLFAVLTEVLLPDCAGNLIVCIDEIDTVRRLPFATDELFAAIRACYNERAENPMLARLTFCLLGVVSPSDLIRDPRTTPFNIGRRIELTDFTHEEAALLGEGLSTTHSGPVHDGASINAKSTLSADEQRRKGTRNWFAAHNGNCSAKNSTVNARLLLSRVLYWTGGHPYLTQRLCQALVEARRMEGSSLSAKFSPSVLPPARLVDLLCVDVFFGKRATQAEPNLAFVSNILLNSELERGSVLEIYRKTRTGQYVEDDPASPVVQLLRLSGVCAVKNGRLATRNRIYARVFDPSWAAANMPDAEIRRQRAAYRAGMFRASAVAAVVIACLGTLASLAYKNGLAASKNAALFQKARDLAYAEALNATHNASKATIAETLAANLASARLRALNEKTTALDAKKREALRADRAAESAHAAELRAVRSAANERGTYLKGQELLSLAQEERGVRKLLGGDSTGMLDLVDSCRTAWNVPHSRQTRIAMWKRWYDSLPMQLGMVAGHTDVVNTMAIDGAGRYLLTASNDMTVRMWDIATGLPIGPAMRHGGKVLQMELSPDGSRMATATDEPRVYLWDLKNRKTVVPPLDTDDTVRAMAFSPDSSRLCVGIQLDEVDASCCLLFDAITGRRVGEPLKGKRPVDYLVFSPDSHWLVHWVSGANQFFLADAREGKAVCSFIRKEAERQTLIPPVFSCDSSELITGDPDGMLLTLNVADHLRLEADGTRFLSTPITRLEIGVEMLSVLCGDGSVRLFDMSPNHIMAAHRAPLIHPQPAETMRLSLDGRELITSSAAQIFAWDTSRSRLLATSFPTSGRLHKVTMSKDFRHLAALVEGGSTVLVWNMTDKGRRSLPGTHSGNQALTLDRTAVSPDGKWIVGHRTPRILQLFSMERNKPAGPEFVHEDIASGALFSPDGHWLAVSAGYHTYLWDAHTGHRMWKTVRQRRDPRALAFSPDSKRLATAVGELGFSSIVQQWDVIKGKTIHGAYAQPDIAFDMAYSPNGKLLAMASGTVIFVRDARTGKACGKPLRHRDTIQTLAFSPDSRRLITGSRDRTARIWDTATGALVCPPLIHGEAITRVAFSPDGRYVATGSEDLTARLWNANTGAPQGPPLSHNAAVRSVAFSRDGRWLLTASDGGATLWEVATGFQAGATLPELNYLTDAGFTPTGIVTRTYTGQQEYWPLSTKLPDNLGDIGRMTERAIAVRRNRQGRDEPVPWDAWRALKK